MQCHKSLTEADLERELFLGYFKVLDGIYIFLRLGNEPPSKSCWTTSISNLPGETPGVRAELIPTRKMSCRRQRASTYFPSWMLCWRPTREGDSSEPWGSSRPTAMAAAAVKSTPWRSWILTEKARSCLSQSNEQTTFYTYYILMFIPCAN